MKLAYIAGPYRDADTIEVEQNILNARRVAVEVAYQDYFPVTPHMNTAGFEHALPDVPDSFWLEGTMKMMEFCDIIVLVDGWEKSWGSREEVKHALLDGKKIYELSKSYIGGVLGVLVEVTDFKGVIDHGEH